MSDLTRYHKRRDFSRTAEPRGDSSPRAAAGKRELSYVIQKHAARRLHYDFRLEWGGALLSWAVPKGPSLDPNVKRLAVQVEPHPLEYGGFEGQIAAGQYGAGTVMVWDRGSWEPGEPDVDQAYARGRLTFTLNGQKLQGVWHLVRSKRGKSGEEWLLFKGNDEFAAPGDETLLTDKPDSALSGLSLEQLAAGQSGAKTKTSPAANGRRIPQRFDVARLASWPGAKVAPLPAKLGLQLATLVAEAPQGEQWLHEIKFDGYRVAVRAEQRDVRLLTRSGLDWTERMPALAAAFSELELQDALIDGEFVALDESGVSDFQSLQNSLSEKADASLVYYAFDLLHYAGHDLTRVPLVERKAMLRELLAQRLRGKPEALTSRIRFSDHVLGTGPSFFENACRLGLEGVVSKRADSRYQVGRSRDWLKIKCGQRQEFVIVGYTEPSGSRSHFGALLVATWQAGALVYRGRVGTGFSDRSLAELYTRLKPLVVRELQLQNAPKGAQRRGVHWVKPELVAQVAFTGVTQEGVLRHPSFQGLRDDKPASEVQREEPKKVNVPQVKLTNPDKVLYPACGLTKRDLLEYAATVAKVLLPHVVNRPLTLVRCPNGEGKPCFFQKHPGDVNVPGLRSVPLREKEGKANYAAIDDEVGLFALVQLGVLEIHTSGAFADDFEHPNVLVFDLDPDPELDFGLVIEAALRLREIFETAKLESFVKTTGGKGLHVCVPIEPSLTWDEAKAFTQRVARALVEEAPNRYLATQSKAERKGKIFIDYLRNGRGATFIAPYSTRARPNAPVATPLFWHELVEGLRPDQFTVQNLAARLESQSEDPFARLATLRQALPVVR